MNGRGVYCHPYSSALCVPAGNPILSLCVCESVREGIRLLHYVCVFVCKHKVYHAVWYAVFTFCDIVCLKFCMKACECV